VQEAGHGQLLRFGFHHGKLGVAIDQDIIRDVRFATFTAPLRIRPSVIGYSRRMRLPSTTPQPTAFNAGSMCSALVSASFIFWMAR
jgi:hypothetical protein